ncbi:sensor histidine kinase [Peribacillus sp. NPDC097295]|uniref:sensor histidine kinase n=1 Tax=Peribacillus sp. NPDC097295 TaxID=3364402 RepID=UPI00382A1E40
MTIANIKSYFKKLNTLRNQIVTVFLTVMMIVLCIVSLLVYKQVGTLMREATEKLIKQTAIEANGRMETLYQQIDMLSNQLVTNGTVQKFVENDERMDSAEKTELIKVINNFHAYSNGISSFELYSTDGKRMYPFSEKKISSMIDQKWVTLANSKKGRLVWIGKDPNDKNYSYAIRRVSLMDHMFTNGGYLLVRISNSYFQMEERTSDRGDYMMLLDVDKSPISDNYGMDIRNILLDGDEVVMIEGKEYMVVKHVSEKLGWTIVILKPTSFLQERITAVRNATLVSGSMGFIIFLVSAFFLATMITNPIKRLTKTMKKAKMDELKTNQESSGSLEFIELNKTYNQMVDNTNHLIQEVYEKELLRSQTELKALQAQIDPHFLYNTLNALYWSLEEKEQDDLADIVIAMSELFRYTIGDMKGNEWVTVSDELDHIERYLQVMKMRLGDRLLWHIEVPPECLQVRVPKLIIQPLVENAIMHGIEKSRRQGTVSIKVRKMIQASSLEISVEDNGFGMDDDTLHSLNLALESEGVSSFKEMGVALINVNKRLHLYYDGELQKGLKLDSEWNKGTRVTFDIPIKGGN